MAIAHFRAQIIGFRRSAVAAAAYRHRTTMRDAGLGEVFSYRTDDALVHTEVALPPDAPEWMRRLVGLSPAQTSEALWNLAQQAERRHDAQVAREIVIALPSELSREQNIRLVRDYIAAEITARGFIADWVFHDNPGNPHVHLMHTLRPLTMRGFGPKASPERDADGALKRTAAGRPQYTRFIGTPEDFVALRMAWGEHANRALAAAGIDAKIDMRSYAARGIDLPAGRHIGPAVHALQRHGIATDVIAEFTATEARRAEIIAANPEIILTLTAEMHAVFGLKELGTTLRRFMPADDARCPRILAAILRSPELVTVREAMRNPLDETLVMVPAQWTMREQLDAETAIERNAARLADADVRVAPSKAEIVRATTNAEAKIGAGAQLSVDQLAALDYLMRPTAIASVVGLAGSGKSTLLDAARLAWEAAGARVHGAALAGVAARGLQASSGIHSRTIASWLAAWDAGKSLPAAGDVYVVDEAGMVGTADMLRLMTTVADAGAKLVLVGDPGQLQPVAAGSPFRAIVEHSHHADLTTLQRQRAAEHRRATAAAATGDIPAALAVYQREGGVISVETMAQAQHELIAAYVADRLSPELPAGATQLALAASNADVQSLNSGIRGALIRAGKLDAGYPFETALGPLEFAAGDRILCLTTRRVTLGDGSTEQLDNGALGTVVASASNRLEVRFDSGRMAALTPEIYTDICHGYAATIHKSQGTTVDRAYVLATGLVDRAMAYVAMSRHRHQMRMFAPQSELRGTLAESLSRPPEHTNALDLAPFLRRRSIPTPAEDCTLLQAIVTAARSRLARIASHFHTLTRSPPMATLLERATALLRRRTVPAPEHVDAASQARATAPAGTSTTIAAPANAQREPSRPVTPVRPPSPLHAPATAADAVARTAASGPRSPTAPTRLDPPAPLPRCRLTITDSHVVLSFPMLSSANDIARAAGFTFDAESKTYRLARGSDTPTELVRHFEPLRAQIDNMLNGFELQRKRAQRAVARLRHGVHSLAISERDGNFRINVPTTAPPRIGAELIAIGARQIIGSKGRVVSYSLSLGYFVDDPDKLYKQLRAIDARVPPPPREPFEPAVHLAPGLVAEATSATLRVTTPWLSFTAEALAPFQPEHLGDGSVLIRTDIPRRERLLDTLDAIAEHHRTLVVPPTSPRNGVDLDHAQLDELLTGSPKGNHNYQRLLDQLQRHFGSTTTIAVTDKVEPGLARKLQRIADFAREQTQAIQRATPAMTR